MFCAGRRTKPSSSTLGEKGSFKTSRTNFVIFETSSVFVALPLLPVLESTAIVTGMLSVCTREGPDLSSLLGRDASPCWLLQNYREMPEWPSPHLSSRIESRSKALMRRQLDSLSVRIDIFQWGLQPSEGGLLMLMVASHSLSCEEGTQTCFRGISVLFTNMTTETIPFPQTLFHWCISTNETARQRLECLIG